MASSKLSRKKYFIKRIDGKKVFIKQYLNSSKKDISKEFIKSKKIYSAFKKSSLASSPKPLLLDLDNSLIGFEFVSSKNLADLFFNSSISDVKLRKLFFNVGRGLAIFHKNFNSKKLSSLDSDIISYGDLAINNILINKQGIPYFIDAQPLLNRDFNEKSTIVKDLVLFVSTFRRIPLKKILFYNRNLSSLEFSFLKGYIMESGISFDYRIYSKSMMSFLDNQNSSLDKRNFIRKRLDNSLKNFYGAIFKDSFSYTKRYQNDSVAYIYDGSYSDNNNIHTFVWNSFEKNILISVLKQFPKTSSYLDFATGSGKVIFESGSLFNDSVGWDISSEMLSLARKYSKYSKFKKKDIFKLTSKDLSTFDIITSFRFFLNSDSSLRYASMFQLSLLLKPKGVFIFNVHANKSSYMFFHYIFTKYVLKKPFRVLSTKDMNNLLKRSGLIIDSSYSYGYLPLQIYSLFSLSFVKRVDLFLSRLLPGLGSHKIYVVKRK